MKIVFTFSPPFSLFLFQQVDLKPELKEPMETLRRTANHIASVSTECGLEVGHRGGGAVGEPGADVVGETLGYTVDRGAISRVKGAGHRLAFRLLVEYKAAGAKPGGGCSIRQ